MNSGLVSGLLLCAGAVGLSGCADQATSQASRALTGPVVSAQSISNPGVGNEYVSGSQPVGQGQMYSYMKVAKSGLPIELGVRFDAAALEGLPKHPATNENCFDMNGDGRIDAHMECALGYDHVLNFPKAATDIAKTPFKYAMVDFNSMGHQPPGIYDVPHFDFHFYLQSNEDRTKIRLGACGEVVNCDDMNTAQMPLPEGYAPAGYASVGAVMGLMGNHLLDITNSPEFHGAPFTKTWIWGTYGGKVTFFEPMITVAYLKTRPQNDCAAYTMPEKFSEPGYYPQQYCINYNKGLQEYTVSLKDFRYFGH